MLSEQQLSRTARFANDPTRHTSKTVCKSIKKLTRVKKSHAQPPRKIADKTHKRFSGTTLDTTSL
jgi:hypothetical protein